MSVQAAADRMEGRMDSPSRSFGLAGVISVGLLYGLVYSGLRLSISHNLATDDVLSNVWEWVIVVADPGPKE